MTVALAGALEAAGACAGGAYASAALVHLDVNEDSEVRPTQAGGTMADSYGERRSVRGASARPRPSPGDHRGVENAQGQGTPVGSSR